MHNSKALLLINTGSPTDLSTKEIRRYLTHFLTDKRVINIPSLIRYPLVYGIIAPLRAKKSRDKYALVWDRGQSPLVLHTEALAKRVQEISECPTFTAMQHNIGSIEQAFSAIEKCGATEVIAVPLFPQYSMSSYENAMSFVQEKYIKLQPPFQLLCTPPYYNHPSYVEALVEQVEKTAEPYSHLLFSFHGIPISQTKPYLGNPDKDYQYQCLETKRIVMEHPKVKALQLTSEVVYQSRFGNGKWLTPILEERIPELAKEGKRRVYVLCPSFVCDCLETLWDIDIHAKELFQGDHLALIPCPNDSTHMAQAIIDLAINQATEIHLWTQP